VSGGEIPLKSETRKQWPPGAGGEMTINEFRKLLMQLYQKYGDHEIVTADFSENPIENEPNVIFNQGEQRFKIY